MKKIAQIGTFDVENYGDLLFPTVLKNRFSNYDIDLFSPKGGKKPFEENVYVFPLEKLEEKIKEKKYKALIIGGGDLIRLDKVASIYKDSIETSLSIWQLPIILGKKYNIPVIFNAPGVPYYFNKNQESIIKSIMKDVDYISVRDNESKLILEKCGVKNIKVVPDTILLIDEIITKSENEKMLRKLQKEKKVPNIDNYIAIQHNTSNINNEFYINKLKELINVITEDYNYNVLLVPIGYIHKDIDFLQKLYDKKNKKIFIVKEKLSPIEMLSVFASSKGYIGTSMHGAITTYSYGNPIMIINVKKLVKIYGLLELINKTNIEVKRIEDIIKIFNNNFFIQNKKEHLNVKKDIKMHFKRIEGKLEQQNNNIISVNYERNILVSVFNELSYFDRNEFEFANVYLDYGEDFNEDNKLIIKIDRKNKKYKFNFEINEEVKNIRIDLIENKYIKINDLAISSRKNYIEYLIPNSMDSDNGLVINSLDPQILIKNNNYKKIEVTFMAEIIDYNDIVYVLNNYIKKINALNNKINILESKNNELERNYKKTTRYYLQKLKRKIINKK